MNKIKAILQNEKLTPLIQFIKFGLVGVSNTAISYGVEMLCYYVLFKNSKFIGILSFLSRLGISTDGNNVKIVITTIIAFVISVTNSYFWNNRYVFGSGKKSFSEHFKTFQNLRLLWYHRPDSFADYKNFAHKNQRSVLYRKPRCARYNNSAQFCHEQVLGIQIKTDKG